MSAATRARLVLFGALGLNLVFVWVSFATADVPEKNTLITIGRFLGLHVALIMIFQLVVLARLPWLDRRLGMDGLTTLHRWGGFTLYWILVLHVSFIVAGFARLDRQSIPAQVLSLAGSVPVLFGMVAFVLLTVVVISSARWVRRRLSYEAWHAVHLVLYAVVVLALLHQLTELTTFTVSSWSRAYWWLLWTLALVALVAGRIVLPVLRNARHRFRVAAVVPESGDVVSVHVTGRHLDRLPARAGQFMLWRFPGHNPWWQVNPWSLSAAPRGTSLRLTAKGIGTTSAGLRDLPVGTRVFAEGPYGALTAAHRTRPGTLLIAGGIGVTPIRALLEELTGPVTVLYRVRSRSDAVLLGELEELARARGARLHVLDGPTSDRPLGAAALAALVPDIAERDVYLCGPERMTVAVLAALRELRVPRAQIHTERFRMAA
ncbi:ferredoxin reductase family protein [Actinoplanes sp. RD1]|uniref:ferredoxin reductase family protein n=1 Tax=Actinoplanes sp. RD1 TaxID=3064538 RepID=UPI0027425F19|nr:ferric reductase-like transmembrane domain-containing protein [Actinoplanes sp. RD1]